jgi:hypothetical protein
LAAPLAADVVGYSRLMGSDEEGTLQQSECRGVLRYYRPEITMIFRGGAGRVETMARRAGGLNRLHAAVVSADGAVYIGANHHHIRKIVR